jgi:hypothetical protein
MDYSAPSSQQNDVNISPLKKLYCICNLLFTKKKGSNLVIIKQVEIDINNIDLFIIDYEMQYIEHRLSQPTIHPPILWLTTLDLTIS